MDACWFYMKNTAVTTTRIHIFHHPISSRAVFRKLFSPAEHPNLSKTRDGTPQSFASRKGGTKLHMAINVYLHTNNCSIRRQVHGNKTLHILVETVDDVCIANSNYER
jgi:hypothetical protein